MNIQVWDNRSENIRDIMLYNISQMINNLNVNEPKPINQYCQGELRTFNNYRGFIPKLKDLIASFSFKQMRKVYDNAIYQLCDHIPDSNKKQLNEYYIQNREIIKDENIRLQLDRLPSMGIDLRKSKAVIRNIQYNFKDYINVSSEKSLEANLQQIWNYLCRARPSNNEIITLNEILSISILLNQLVDKIEKNLPMVGFQEYLSNIKIEELSIPFRQLFTLINNKDISLGNHSQNSQLMKQIKNIYKIQEQVDPTEFLSKIKRHVSQSQEEKNILHDMLERESDDGHLKQQFQEMIPLIYRFVYATQPRTTKLSKPQLLELRNALERRVTQIGQSAQMEELQRRLQAANSKVQLYIQSEAQINSVLLEKEEKIKKMQEIMDKCRREMQEKLKRIKSQFQASLLETKNAIEDERLYLSKSVYKIVKVEINKIRQYFECEKAKEIGKCEEKRRSQKEKITKMYDEAFYQLESFKERYYTQITSKLCSSKLDMSMSRISGTEVNDCAVGTSMMILENSFLGEESIGVGPDRDEVECEAQSPQELIAKFKKQFQDKIEKLNKEIAELKEVVGILENQGRRGSDELRRQREENMKLAQKLREYQNALSQSQQVMQKLKKTILELKQANSDYANAIKSLTEAKKDITPMGFTPTPNDTLDTGPLLIPYHKALFQGEALQDSKQKEKLIKHITSYMRRPILKTKLLHKFDPHNKANFHLYIDNKPNLVCIVKTKHAIIAGFYPGQLKEGQLLNQGGLLISVTNDMSYQLINKKSDKVNYRGMTYDPYYAIFGNAEMRIRSGEKRVFCNFGIQNSYYDYTGKPRNIEAFLNEGEREVQFQFCEFYQLFLQESLYSSYSLQRRL